MGSSSAGSSCWPPLGGSFTRPQREHKLATIGPHAYVRHPQYAGFILIMLGFLVQWPTLLTLFMFPILVVMYVRLARREEREALTEFGEAYSRYVVNTPAFVPRLRHAVRKQT
jgi:protein-S-isoprenylcysteine O-methyltransferase Ste14